MLEGEKQALLKQVTVQIEATERRLRALGLKYVKVGLWDERNRQPIGHHDHLLAMAEGRCPSCGASEQAKEAHNSKCTIVPPSIPAPEGGEPAERAEGSDQ